MSLKFSLFTNYYKFYCSGCRLSWISNFFWSILQVNINTSEVSSKQNIMKEWKTCLSTKLSKLIYHFNKVCSHESKAQLLTFPAPKAPLVQCLRIVHVLNYNKSHKKIEQDWVQINLSWEYICIPISQNIKLTWTS